jgi:hypothetical protein
VFDDSELCSAEFTERFEHAVPARRRVRQLHHRLVHQRGEQQRRCGCVDVTLDTHRLHRVQRERPGEDRKTGKERPLVGGEQVVGPTDEFADCGMPADGRQLRIVEEIETGLEALRERFRTDRP